MKMKKWICIFLILCLFPSIAIADGLGDFLERWNKITYIYDAPSLSADMFTFEDGMYCAYGDGFKIIVVASNGKALQGAFSTQDTDLFLKMCVTMGASIVTNKTAQTYSQYRGNVLDMYLRVVAGQEPRPSMFDVFEYTIQKRENELIYTIVGQE